MNKVGILLSTDFDVIIEPSRDSEGKITSGLVLGDTTDQNAVMVLQLFQGNLKEDPLLGAGLTKYMRGKLDRSQIETRIRLHFERAGIDYDAHKERLNVEVK